MPTVTCNVYWCKFNDEHHCQNEDDQIELWSGGGQVFQWEQTVSCGFKPQKGWMKLSDGRWIKINEDKVVIPV